MDGIPHYRPVDLNERFVSRFVYEGDEGIFEINALYAFQLQDITGLGLGSDIIINRTLVYGALTASVVGI